MTPALTVTNMSKSFAGPRVLDSVSLSIEPGEIRALVGENGSGKSTLIKILAGFHLPDEGSAEIAGQSLHLGDGAASEALGLRFVHQDLGLVNSLDAVDNMALGVGYSSFRGGIRWRQERKRVRAALAELGYHFDIRQTVDRLAMSERTALAVARALTPRQAPAKVLILDEPTANLPNAEAERLYTLARRVAAARPRRGERGGRAAVRPSGSRSGQQPRRGGQHCPGRRVSQFPGPDPLAAGAQAHPDGTG